MQEETEAPHPRVTIDAVTFGGAIHLSEPITAQIAASLEHANFDSDSDWIESFQEAVKEAWQRHGYLYAKASAQTHVLSGDSRGQRVSVTVHVDEGLQYRLGEIRFSNANEFPPAEMRKQFPMRDGDVYDLQKIRQGLEALRRLYGTQGYIDCVASPEIQVDNAHRSIFLLIEVEEGRQFSVGSVEVLGLDQKTVDSVLKAKLRPGDLFNPELVEQFFQENTPVLPSDASPRDDMQLTESPWSKPDDRNGTVAIVFDFRSCP